MIRILPALCLLVAAPLITVADEIVWPLPECPAGVPYAQFATPQGDTNFLDHIRRARSQRTDMILDGDSITDYWQSTGRSVFEKIFAPRRAIDFGISGNHTENVIWRVEHGELDTLHPKLAMLLIGVNNSGSPVPDVVAGVTKVVQLYREKCPEMHVLLLGIFPHGHLPTDPAREQVRQTNALLAKLDDGAHVTFLDIGEKFLQSDGTMSPEVMPDFLHPSLKGYEIWGDAVQALVDKYCAVDATPPAAVPTLTTAQVAAAVPPQAWPYPLEAPAGTPSTAFPMYYVGWLRGFQQNLDRLKQGPCDLVFDGDTVLMNFPGAANTIVRTRYGNIKWLDLAMYGDQVQQMLWRVRHGSLDGQNPKLIVILAGAANLGQEVGEVAGGTKLLLNEYKKRCPGAHILLLGVLPRGANDDANGLAWIQKLNAAYANLADDRVTFLDLGSKLSGEIGPERLTEKGYATFAEAIQPVIDKYLPEAAAKP